MTPPRNARNGPEDASYGPEIWPPPPSSRTVPQDQSRPATPQPDVGPFDEPDGVKIPVKKVMGPHSHDLVEGATTRAQPILELPKVEVKVPPPFKYHTSGMSRPDQVLSWLRRMDERFGVTKIVYNPMLGQTQINDNPQTMTEQDVDSWLAAASEREDDQTWSDIEMHLESLRKTALVRYYILRYLLYWFRQTAYKKYTWGKMP